MSSEKLVKCCSTSTETVGLLGTGAQDVHLDFHTAPELCFSEQSVGQGFSFNRWGAECPCICLHKNEAITQVQTSLTLQTASSSCIQPRTWTDWVKTSPQAEAFSTGLGVGAVERKLEWLGGRERERWPAPSPSPHTPPTSAPPPPAPSPTTKNLWHSYCADFLASFVDCRHSCRGDQNDTSKGFVSKGYCRRERHLDLVEVESYAV